MFHLSQETDADWHEVEQLYDLSFAPGRQALSSYQLRQDVEPIAELCLVARDGLDVVAGAIRYWPIRIGAAPALLLGPVAVHPTRQGEGLGGLLIAETLALAEGTGWKRALLIGDEPYYRRFGFSRDAARHVLFPPPTNPARVLGRSIGPNGFDGVGGDVNGWR